MKISIIIPVYKVEDYLDRCVQSVVNQTYRDLEIILVDDGSPDRCPEMCDEWAKKDNRIKVVHKKNGGLSSARNAGIDAATGEYIYFLDSDDWISNDCIEKLAEPLKKRYYDFVIGNYKIIGSDMSYPVLNEKGEINGVSNIARSFQYNNWYCMAWNKLCNIDFLKRNDLFFKVGLFHEDVLWSSLLSFTADSMFSIQSITYYYFIREKSITTSEDTIWKLFYYKKALMLVYDYQVSNNIYFIEADGVANRLKGIICGFMSMLNYNSYKQYKEIRLCDVRNSNFKGKVYSSTKSKILNFDLFLPIPLGYLYKQLLCNTLALKSWILKYFR